VEALQQRILADGRNLGRGILKVDSFVNHQVDPMLMRDCAQELARRFRPDRPTKVLTAEISGIAPALLTALELNVSVVYARKHKPITMPDTVFLTTAPSHTKGNYVDLMVSPEYLGAIERVGDHRRFFGERSDHPRPDPVGAGGWRARDRRGRADRENI
jgi:xanthine phosphoribosyltransferase